MLIGGAFGGVMAPMMDAKNKAEREAFAGWGGAHEGHQQMLSQGFRGRGAAHEGRQSKADRRPSGKGGAHEGHKNNPDRGPFGGGWCLGWTPKTRLTELLPVDGGAHEKHQKQS